ncbi:MAG: HD domain-containing protein [Actinobacteria bacterium]|nr:HD domain-containing protein [Actinomycetota bacterium]
MEHGLRACLIATRLADRVGVSAEVADDVFWVSLLAMVGCSADSYEVHLVWGDDIALRAGMFEAGPSQAAMARYLLSRAGSDGGPARRATASARLLASGMRAAAESMTAHCQVTGQLAEQLRFGTSVSEPLQHAFARWDGKGLPRGTGGEEIELAARVFTVANYVEVQQRLHGAEGAIAFLRRCAGSLMDPSLVEALASTVDEVFGDLGEESWDAVITAEPVGRPRLVGDGLDAALAALGDFADLKAPWFSGRSRRVAELAAAAAEGLRLPAAEVACLRRAALVHGLGRTGIPNTIWDKPGPLTPTEQERMHLYPYFTDRILRRGSLRELADLASSPHERLDGSGYPRGLQGAAIGQPARVLAAASDYDALTSLRPQRPALGAEQAARLLREEAAAGRLDGDAVEAVLVAAGHASRRRRPAPADLTAREVEVLRLIATGHTTASVAAQLNISPKTADRHIQHIYGKIGASNRSLATLFAMRNGLL